jgi:hypothetical protein
MLRFFEEQRLEDRRMADEREERYPWAAEEREARREAHYEVQLAALTIKATADRHPCGYTTSKGRLFSGDRGQELLPWLQLFRWRRRQQQQRALGQGWEYYGPTSCTHPRRTSPRSCA